MKHTGAAMSPFNAWVMLKGMETLDLRVRAQAEAALDTAVAEFFIEQRLRDDADHFSVVGQCSICQRAHQSDIASTIDDSDAGLSEEGTHGAGSGMIGRIIPRTGTTIDTNPA